MKKQINPTIRAHLIRGAFYLLLLFALCVIPFAFGRRATSTQSGTLQAVFRPETQPNVPHRTLTFAERVSYQRAIEDVYWRHRIWPRDNPGPKPPLDAVISREQIEKKVTDYLRKSQLVTNQRGSPITASELQAEMERMAGHTRQPDVLRELFAALGNDPFVIAECLARLILAERLAHQNPKPSAAAAVDAAGIYNKTAARLCLLITRF